MKYFTVTYEIVTPESAENGDYAEIGYAKPYGWRFPLHEMSKEDVEACYMTLREALQIATFSYDCGNWLSSYEETLSYQDGSVIVYNLHYNRNITNSSYNRLKRLLKIK